jgi:branched-chain amino acid aminotransferase
MPTRVFVDGRVVPPEAATVSVFDRGFLYGDSIVEVMRARRGRLVDGDAHLERLERSAIAVRMQAPARAAIAEAIDATLAAAAEPEARVRVILSRGPGDMRRALADLVPHPVVIAEPLALPGPDLYERGVAVAAIGAVPAPVALAPGVKTGSALGTVLAIEQARDAGADEAIRLDTDGRVVEGATSNVFAVRGEELLTPPVSLGLLAGVTRGRVMALARDGGLAVVERAFSIDDLRAASEAFLTSSIRGVVPIRAVDGANLRVGATTRRVMALYQRYLDSL